MVPPFITRVQLGAHVSGSLHRLHLDVAALTSRVEPWRFNKGFFTTWHALTCCYNAVINGVKAGDFPLIYWLFHRGPWNGLSNNPYLT